MKLISLTKPLRTIFVILPCYNEAENLIELFKEFEEVFSYLKFFGFKRRYIIVDDGSVDETINILENFKKLIPITIVKHQINLGLGKTIRDGLYLAAKTAKDDDIIVTMDSDQTHPPLLIFSMVFKILERNDIVIASRYKYGSSIRGLSKFRKILSIIAGVLFKITFNIPNVRDYTCGFRAYSAKIIKQGFNFYNDRFIEQTGFQCMAEILLKLVKMNNRIVFVEVPMVLRYELKKGESKMKIFKTIFNTLKMLIKY